VSGYIKATVDANGPTKVMRIEPIGTRSPSEEFRADMDKQVSSYVHLEKLIICSRSVVLLSPQSTWEELEYP
jgi:hypothetical protein